MNNLYSIFDEFPNLYTERLNLRKINENDCAEIFEIYSDDDIVKYEGISLMKSVDEAKEFIKKIDRGYKEKYFIRWCITEKDKEKVIGLVAIHHLDYRNNKAELGYILSKHFWRQGIATQAVRKVISFAFKDMGLHRLECKIHPENIASIGFAENLGFEKEGYEKECAFNNSTEKYEDRLYYAYVNIK